MSEEAVWQARFSAARQAMSIFVPFLYGRSRAMGLTVSSGIEKAIKQNLAYSAMAGSSEFMSAIKRFAPVLQAMAGQYRGADLRPGERIEDVAAWLVPQVARMTFTFEYDDPQGGVTVVEVRGAQVVAPVINLDAMAWWQRLIADLYQAFGASASVPAPPIHGWLNPIRTAKP